MGFCKGVSGPSRARMQCWVPPIQFSRTTLQAAEAIFQEGDSLYQQGMLLPVRLRRRRELSRRGLSESGQLGVEPIDGLVCPGIDTFLQS